MRKTVHNKLTIDKNGELEKETVYIIKNCKCSKFLLLRRTHGTRFFSRSIMLMVLVIIPIHMLKLSRHENLFQKLDVQQQ